MEYVNLLGTSYTDNGIEPFALTLFNAIGITNSEERESDHYIDGRYFRASRDGLIFTVTFSDEETNQDLPYWVQITREVPTGEPLELTIDHLLKNSVLPAGFRFARIANFGKINEQRFDY
ncbi:hypothetical protein [Noviherbaspirillum pedocola]|uniref:Uncharacterized protein n=1 Tax=Noviherbaspirillum pedocola TaxID=2801341 RepID=A0A934SXD6_9BURK|nr:hypothetical protein [Noviherbaspirillum pedocola]MBK4738300.1 hypothetical protein [Noviherbaspirillum pedocola]